MERGRKTKIITITALVVAIVTMSLGFAVFSNVLTISSSATVKPNAEDYIVTIYGVEYGDKPELTVLPDDIGKILPYLTSKTTSIPINGAVEATPAIIDNRNFKISNLNVTISETGEGAGYIFLVKNEGKKSVYMNLSFLKNMPLFGTCTAEEELSQEMVEQLCEEHFLFASLASSLNEEIKVDDFNSYEILPNDYVILILLSATEQVDTSVEYTVKYSDVEIEFSSVDNSQSS